MMRFGRRELLAGIAFGLAGCGSLDRGEAQAPAVPRGRAMLVHRDAGCGCCEKWAQMASAQGYTVKLVDEPDMAAVKARLGVPGALAACHTAEVDGAVIEGHVPFAVLARFLAERPADAVGLAVAGMPVGSPGMEVAGAEPDPLTVHAFDAAGRSRVYAA